MSDRRKVLETLAKGATGMALEGSGLGAWAPPDCAGPNAGPNAGHLPNVVVTSHQGERARFYDDLIAGKVVLVHCMSIAGHDEHPVSENLARVQRHLGGRLGRDVFIYSLTVDPERDTPGALAHFARRLGARRGWLFLTGAPEDMQLLRSRLYVDNVGHGAHADHAGHGGAPGGAGPDCSLGLLRYGNEAVGLWGACPAIADPEWIARRVGWVVPGERPAGFSRRGPAPLPPRMRERSARA